MPDAYNKNTAFGLSEQENTMSKITVLAGIALVVTLGACAKHSHKAPTVEVVPAPIYVEPSAGKSKF